MARAWAISIFFVSSIVIWETSRDSPPRPRASHSSSAARRASRWPMRRLKMKPSITFSSTSRFSTGWMIWKVRAIPARARSCAGSDGDVPALEADAAAGGSVETRHEIDQRGFPRAVGPDDAEDLPALQPEGDLVDGDKAAEAPADPDGFQVSHRWPPLGQRPPVAKACRGQPRHAPCAPRCAAAPSRGTGRRGPAA